MDVLMVKSNGEWVGIPAIKGEKGDTGNTGATGQNGADGVSPSVSVSEITGGHKVSVTDASGTSEFNVMDGVDGQDGAPGQDGQNGQNGQDGYSPTVQVADITGGHQVTITDASGTHVFNVMDGDPTTIINDNAGDGDTAETWSADKEEAVKKELEESKASVVIDNITDNPIVITDGIVGLSVRSMEVSFSPQQEGSGDSSPTNIRPITGWDGVNIYQSGKNLLDVVDTKRIALNASYSNFTSENGIVAITGNATGGYIMPCLPETGYVYSFESTYIGENLTVRVYEFTEYPTVLSSGVLIVNDNSSVGRNIPPKAFTTTSAGKWLVVGFYAHHSENITIQKMQIELGSTATAYEPYSGTIIPISWQSEAGTVYGGTLNALTGVLTITHILIDITNTTGWVKSTSYSGGFYMNTSIFGIKAQTPFICSHAKTVTNLTQYDTGTCYCDSSVNIRIMPEGSDYTDWETYRQEQSQNGTPICIVAELRETSTVQLTPIQIALLSGVNTLWTDADSMEIAYPIDTKKYVDVGARDVQINGTSILENGVANIPVANSANYGAVKVSGGNRGIEMDNGFLQIVYASSGYIKGGSDARKPIVPYTQHESVFYGLAKLAGVDLASSSTPIGTFTEQAMFAIQKMFGINQRWEYIRHIETTQDLTEVTINTDEYGESFELQRMILTFRCDQSTTGARDNFYCLLTGKTGLGVTQQHSAPSLQYTTATTGMAAQIDIETHQIAPITIRTIVASGDGNTQNLQSMAKMVSLSSITAFKIYQSASDKSLIPSGAIIDLYGIKA